MTVRTREAGTEVRLLRAPVPALPRLHQIILPTPWEVGPVQIYVIEGDPLTLVDTGVKSLASREALEAALDALGYGLGDVGRVVLTHFHEDHLGQVQTLREAGAELEVFAHEHEAPMIEFFSAERDERLAETQALFEEYGVPSALLDEQTAWRRQAMRESPPLSEATRVENLVRDGDGIPFKEFELEVIHAPGHTAGHLLLHEPQSGTLITGDHLMGDAVPFTDNYYVDGAPDPADPLRRRPRFRGLPEYMRSVRALKRQRFQTILPAHGGLIRRPDRAIEDAILFYEVRIQRIERGLRTLAAMGQEVTGWQIWEALFPKADPVKQMRTRMLMVIGALDVLEAQGICVTRRRDDGVLVHEHAR
ncbi:MAG: MBL fold metallo-hydrolase [Proteobacteria bacterium]|nr:MBL fold metallo-hydrolase [Pseudomonadota bacterium]